MSDTDAPNPDGIGGLTSEEAADRLAKFGPNRLPEPKVPGVATIFLRQFLSPFIYVLLVAALASIWFQQYSNAVFIFLVLVMNAVIGTIQEFSAQKSAAALKNLVRGETRVLRDGKTMKVSTDAVVPGDIVVLSSGDKVPADLVLLQTVDLKVDESMLTGESVAVEKKAGEQTGHYAPVSDRIGEAFAGTIVNYGRGLGRVVRTGEKTELGKIAHHVIDADGGDPPLVIRVRRFTYQVAGAILVSIVLLVGLMAVQGGYSVQAMGMIAIGLAVSAIPEGLPAALTVALAIGMRRMARHNVIIRKLVAVEALGSCTFICSDKTGTLTVNELTIRRLLMPDGTEVSVSGEGVSAGGALNGTVTPAIQALCETGVLANESHLEYAQGDWVSDGDIVDVAFLVLAKKAGLSLGHIGGEQRQVNLIPYESQNAYSGSVNLAGDAHVLHVKGSPEKLLAMCDRMQAGTEVLSIDRRAIEDQFTRAAEQGYRIIALARCSVADPDSRAHPSEMIFLGMVAMIDPVRPEALDAVRRCHEGGIEVAMVTGDHPATAKAIAVELEICNPSDPVVVGAMLQATEDEKLRDEMIINARVFARIAPEQKSQIVDTLVRHGNFVAVTGDGVNDAPAMRRAHAGVAMGMRGTDVARETAELIITDDNFNSIVDGIEQGRIVYNNIRKVISLLVATGFSALLFFFLAVAGGLPMPLLATQLLWLNLVANGLQDVALAFEAREGGELTAQPRSPGEPIFERHILEHVLIIGSLMGVLALAVFSYLYHSGMEIDQVRNLTLMLLVLFGNIHALSARSEMRSIFQIPLRSNLFLVLAVPVAQAIHIGAMYMPGLSDVLGLTPITFSQWTMLAGVALLLLAGEELHKWLLRRRFRAADRHRLPMQSKIRLMD